MTSTPTQDPLHTAPSSPFLSQQPFPGAVSAVLQPRPTVMEIPPPLPRPSFILHTDGRPTDDANLVYSEWILKLDEALNAGMSSPQSHDLQQSRRVILSAACHRHDIFYIVMHQRYCTWSRNKLDAYNLMYSTAPAAIDRGFAALSVLLKTNDALSPTHLEWFVDFPTSTFDSFLPAPILASITKQIIDFILLFAAHWQDLRTRIVHRGFPVLTWEMRTILRCSSITVQDLIFTLSRRLLGCPDGPLATAFADLLNRDRAVESAMFQNPVTPEYARHSRNELTKAYITLVSRVRSQMRNMSPMPHASPSPGAPAATAPTAQNNYQIPMKTPVSRSVASESRTLNWSPRNQHSQCSPVLNTNGSSTNQGIRQPGPSMPSAAGSPNMMQYACQPIASSQAQPRDSPVSMAQHGRPAVPRGNVATPNLTARLDPAPGKVARRIPESEYPQNAYGLASLKAGLHLSRQRSPRRVPLDIKHIRYFQHVDKLIVQPTNLDVSIHLTEIKFSLSEEQLQILPMWQTESDLWSLPIVRFANNALRFRVRVCRFPKADPEPGESKWIETSTFWPELIQMSINSMPCLLSRKQHFHTDLPAEMTCDVKAGYNELRVSLPLLSTSESGYNYFIAVEQVIVQAYVTVWRSIHNHPHISTDATLEIIRHRFELCGSGEVALVGSTSNVSICDPISSKMCNTPIRSINCKHLECFDLENWLQSRPNKPGSEQNEPCQVDSWACPICRSDARPSQLRICDYFSDVVKQLRESGRSDTRTIVMSENGEWQPLNETQRRERASQAGGSLIPRNVEVVEILDD